MKRARSTWLAPKVIDCYRLPLWRRVWRFLKGLLP